MVPVTSMPGARALVEVRLVTRALVIVVLPVIGPAVKASVTPEPVAVAGPESVIWVAESTDWIVVPGEAMPGPETNMPGARALVEVRLVTTALVFVVVPVMGLAVKTSVEPAPVAMAYADSVIWVAESTDAIVVPGRISVPETSMPGARALVEVRLVTAKLKSVVLPEMGPAVKARVTLVPVAVGAAESVIWVAESTDLIAAPAGIPVPETSMPGARAVVEERLVTTALALFVVPVMDPAVNASVEPVPVAVAFADSVIWVAESTDLIVVPAGISVPVTTMPGARALVEVRLLTTALELCVVPVVGLAVKASVEPVPVAVAFADSVI